MLQQDWHRINSVEILDDYKLNLLFNDNSQLIIDISQYFSPGSVFCILKDREVFQKVRIVGNGRALEFPQELDFCADSLWLKAHPEKSMPY